MSGLVDDELILLVRSLITNPHVAPSEIGIKMPSLFDGEKETPDYAVLRPEYKFHKTPKVVDQPAADFWNQGVNPHLRNPDPRGPGCYPNLFETP